MTFIEKYKNSQLPSQITPELEQELLKEIEDLCSNYSSTLISNVVSSDDAQNIKLYSKFSNNLIKGLILSKNNNVLEIFKTYEYWINILNKKNITIQVSSLNKKVHVSNGTQNLSFDQKNMFLCLKNILTIIGKQYSDREIFFAYLILCDQPSQYDSIISCYYIFNFFNATGISLYL